MCPHCNCCPVVQLQLSLGVVVALKAATSLRGDARNWLILFGFFYLLPVLAGISVANN